MTIDDFSRREQKMLLRLSQGFSELDIRQAFAATEDDVQALCGKLEAQGLTHAACLAFRQGLV